MTLVLVVSSLNISKISFSPVSATNYEEVPIDYAWMNDTIHVLSEIVRNNLSYGLNQGRLFGTEGDRAASDYIYKWMIENTNKLNVHIYKQRIGDDNYNGQNKTIKKIYDKSNDKIDILSLSLIFTNGTGNGAHTATIPCNESFPVPKNVYWTHDVTSDGLKKVVLFGEHDFDCLIKETSLCSYIIMDYSNQYGVGDFCEQLVYIQNYSQASENETRDKMHLIKFNTNESEDTYMEKIQNVIDTGGDGFICISPNPSFLKNLTVPIFGISVSPKEGSKILDYLAKNQNVSISFTDNSEQTGIFSLYTPTQCLGEKKIGLIEEHGDQPLFYPKIGPITIPIGIATAMFILCNIPSNYVGFILYNKTLSYAHYMASPTGIVYQTPNKFSSFSNYHRIPYLYVNGSISFDTGGSINIWDWANDPNLKASFSIGEQRNDNAESYNVVCEIQGKNQNKSIMISGGHHDFFWGQGASDNAVGTAIMLGILKWLNDNNITPEYNLTFVSFSGEENADRGSGFYAFNETLQDKNKNISYMLNLDWLAYNTPNSTLFIPVTDDNLRISINNTVTRTNYVQVINHSYRQDIKTYPVSNDALPFYERYGLGLYGDPKRDIKLLEINKEKKLGKYLDAYYARHRTGKNHQIGDSLGGIDWKDFRVTADITLNITKFLILEPPKDEFINCTFNEFDICGDGLNDSVKILFTATTNRTSWATVKATLYNRTTGQIVSYNNSTGFTIYQGVNKTGCINVTLFPNQPPGIYNASVKIYDEKMNLDDECHQLVTLFPYSKPIADFVYSLDGWFNHTVNFTDTSMASPGATINQWYWNFDDLCHSTEQHPRHTYLLKGEYTVTLRINDTNGLSDTVTKTVTIPNYHPSVSFSVESSVYQSGQSIEFTSTSSDGDGEIANTTWDFGDGTIGYGESIEHTYLDSGIYSITLTVVDDSGASNSTTQNECLIIADALVDDNFQDNASAHKWDTIQEGINDVENGDIIYVFNGSYNPFEINKSVTLYGESRDNVRINGGNPSVKIRHHNVSLNGFNISGGTNGIDVYVKYGTNQTSNVTIKNCNIFNNNNIGMLLNQSKGCTIENCSIKQSNIGIKIIDSTNNEISKCTINHSTYGVYAFNSSDNFIGSPSIANPYPTDCFFTLCHDSIYLKDSDYNFILGCDIDGTPSTSGTSAPTKGIYLNESANNTISTCYIHDMTGKGMHLNDSTWNKIEHCKITWNPIGVYFDDSPENLLAQNHFGGNSEFAVYLPYDTQNNHIYYNDFFVNGNGSTNQTWDANGAKGAENLWSKEGNRTLTKTGNGEGNYWSDYIGEDNDHDGIGDTPYQINSSGVERNDSYPVMEPYGWCNFTQDSTPPVITNVTATPHTVGFGYDVTINATVTDNVSNISLVKVNIIYPDNSSENHTMNCTGNSTYRYTFTDTWIVGQYNFVIWAMDDTYNTNSSGGHHFHVSASATISISTLKDLYHANEYINITDPPNQPENYTLVGRGLTWDKYYNSTSGCNVLEVSAGPINYQQNNGTWTPIIDSLYQLASNHPAYSYGYRIGNEHGLFGVYFKPNVQNNWPVAFAYNKSNDPTINVIRSKLVGVGYVDPKNNWSYQYLQNVQNSQGQFTGNTATYPGVFTGTDATWSYGNTGLKEAITMSNTTKTLLQNHPPSSYGLNDTTSYLVFITKLDYQNLNIYNASGMLTGNITISDIGVDFKDALGVFKCGLPLGDAYELGNESVRQKLIYRIVHLNGNTYLLSGLKITDLSAMTFPVVIDPTLTVYSTASDGYIYKSDTDYTRAQTATTGTVDYIGQFITIGQKKMAGLPATYYVYRGFVFFDTSTLPSNAFLDSATLSFYKKDDYSTTDFSITVQNGQPVYPHNPLQSSDYNRNYYAGNGGTYNTSGLHNGYNNISLTQLGWITKGGTTKLCLRSSRDINGNTPTGNEYVNVYANEKGSGYQPKLVIHYRNQSKIKNTGSTLGIKGYLLIQIQYYNTGQGKWIVEKDTINETSPRTINGGSQLALDTIFNGHVRTNDLTHNSSNYRVYAAFRDPDNNILKTNDGKELVAWWQFTVDTGT